MTTLELAVLEKISEDYPELRAVLDDLKVIKREYSGAGSFTHFQTLKNRIKNIPEFKRLSLNTVVHISELENGLGGFLEVSECSPEMLELYTFGEELWSGKVSEFYFE